MRKEIRLFAPVVMIGFYVVFVLKKVSIVALFVSCVKLHSAVDEFDAERRVGHRFVRRFVP